jgi:hypothetical protein
MSPHRMAVGGGNRAIGIFAQPRRPGCQHDVQPLDLGQGFREPFDPRCLCRIALASP